MSPDPDDAVVLRLAASEDRPPPTDATDTATDTADAVARLDRMLRLAEVFEQSGARLREWADTAREVAVHPDVSGTAPLSPGTWARAEEELRGLAGGPQGLLDRSTELEADAVVLRATVGTYRWIDDLQATAHRALGSLGTLGPVNAGADRDEEPVAPHVRLGGVLVAAGLIETDALERDGVATYLSELAAEIPELMDHVVTGGGLLDSLQVRALMTVGHLGGEGSRSATSGGLRASGISPLDVDWGAALRDVAVDLDAATTTPHRTHRPEPGTASATPTPAPEGLAALLALHLAGASRIDAPAHALPVGEGRLLVLVASPPPPRRPRREGRLRLVAGDHSEPAALAAAAVLDAARALDHDAPVHVLLVGHGTGGATAIEAAAHLDGAGQVVVDQVVTADAPATLLGPPGATVPVLGLEDHTDPVALLGSLVGAADEHRLTVMYDAAAAPDLPPPVAGGAAADRSGHPLLVDLLERWRTLGFLRAR